MILEDTVLRRLSSSSLAHYSKSSSTPTSDSHGKIDLLKEGSESTYHYFNDFNPTNSSADISSDKQIDLFGVFDARFGHDKEIQGIALTGLVHHRTIVVWAKFTRSK